MAAPDQRLAHHILSLEDLHVEDEETQRSAGAVVLQHVERWLAVFIERDTSPSMTVSSGLDASAFTMPGYRTERSLWLREQSCILPPVLIAHAL
jgi:hypothetical protein